METLFLNMFKNIKSKRKTTEEKVFVFWINYSKNAV